MGAFLLHLGATTLCAHSGQAKPMSPNARVLVAGQPVATQASPYAVAGCILPPAAGGPCATGVYSTAATRVLVGGVPVLLQTSQAQCVPTGTPLLSPVTQTRVMGL